MRLVGGVAFAAVVGLLAWFGWAAQHTTATGAAVNVAAPEDVPARTMQAYVKAVATAPADCAMRWEVLAGFGAIESGNGTYHGDGQTRTINQNGTVTPPIVGPALDGGGFALIWDTDGGAYDGDTTYDRAVGLTQAIPSTWEGVMGAGHDPQNVDDAAEFTVRKVCADAGGPVDSSDNLTKAAYRYNPSTAYVHQVVDRIGGYDQWAASNPTSNAQPGPVAKVDEPALADIFRTMGDSGKRRWTQFGASLSRDGESGVFDKAYSYVDPAISAALGRMAPPKGAVSPVSSDRRDDSAAGSSAAVAGLPGSEGLQPYFAERLSRLAAAAPGGLSILSGYRSTAEQEQIIANHDGECGVWVACVTNGVCGSMHCKGLAVDLTYPSDATKAWVHDHAADYQLTFPMSYEDWHIEPIGAR